MATYKWDGHLTTLQAVKYCNERANASRRGSAEWGYWIGRAHSYQDQIDAVAYGYVRTEELSTLPDYLEPKQ